MKPVTITSEIEFTVVGMSFYGDPFNRAASWDEDNEIGHLWKRFSRFLHRQPGGIKNQVKTGVALEIHFLTDETETKGNFEIFVGMPVSNAEDVPFDCQVKFLPATRYAVFTLRGNEIVSDWEHTILREWLAASEYEISLPCSIQYYDERFKGMDKVAESVIDVYVPVKEKAGQVDAE